MPEPRHWLVLAALIGALGLGASGASSAAVADYSVADLLKPCMEGDNDSRWGEVAESECEQYIIGFTDAIMSIGDPSLREAICLPAENRPDEVRWAFMRWAHEHYDQRGMPAAEGLLATLKAAFPCE